MAGRLCQTLEVRSHPGHQSRELFDGKMACVSDLHDDLATVFVDGCRHAFPGGRTDEPVRQFHPIDFSGFKQLAHEKHSSFKVILPLC
jgi:hypothetical protein